MQSSPALHLKPETKMRKGNDFQYIIAESELNSQAKISCLVELASLFQSKILDSKRRKKDVVFFDVNELEILTDELLSLSGSLAGDLSNCYSTIKRQSLNVNLSEDINPNRVSKIAREVWQLIESAKSVSHLTLAK